MKRVAFLLGLGIGFLLGSEVGRGPYEKLEATVRSASRRPELRDMLKRAKESAQAEVLDAANEVGHKGLSVIDAFGLVRG